MPRYPAYLLKMHRPDDSDRDSAGHPFGKKAKPQPKPVKLCLECSQEPALSSGLCTYCG